MKITKRQLIKIIKEEKAKLLGESFSTMRSRASGHIKDISRGGAILNEMWGDSVETGSDLIDFAKAYAGLGGAVQEQVDAVVASYNNGGFSPEFDEVVYEQNPNAIRMAYDKLGRVLGMMDNDDALMISEALQEAMEIYQRGDDEVEADARAAGDL